MIEQYIPMFGDTSPTFFDKFSAFLLALGFSLGYAIFMAKASTCFIGEYTRAMVLNLLGGMVFGAIVKAVLAFIAFHFLYFKIFTDKNVLWAVAKALLRQDRARNRRFDLLLDPGIQGDLPHLRLFRPGIHGSIHHHSR